MEQARQVQPVQLLEETNVPRVRKVEHSYRLAHVMHVRLVSTKIKMLPLPTAANRVELESTVIKQVRVQSQQRASSAPKVDGHQPLLHSRVLHVAKESTTPRTDAVLRVIVTIVAQASTATTKHHKPNQIVKAAVQESTTQPLDQQLRAHVLIVVLKPFLLHQHLKRVAIAKHVQQATINQALVSKAAL